MKRKSSVLPAECSSQDGRLSGPRPGGPNRRPTHSKEGGGRRSGGETPCPRETLVIDCGEVVLSSRVSWAGVSVLETRGGVPDLPRRGDTPYLLKLVMDRVDG